MERTGRESLAHLDFDDLLQMLASDEEVASAVREEILSRSMPIIDAVIEDTFSRSGFEHEALFRSGYLGLLNAVHNFDLSHGRAFRDYAEGLVKGEIRQHIREQVRRTVFPAWLHDLNRQIESMEAKLLHETGELPTLSELATAVNITEDGIAEIFKARRAMSYVSLDASQRENDPVPEIDIAKIRSIREATFPIEVRIRIASALEKLAGLQNQLFRALFQAGSE